MWVAVIFLLEPWWGGSCDSDFSMAGEIGLYYRLWSLDMHRPAVFLYIRSKSTLVKERRGEVDLKEILWKWKLVFRRAFS